jgi:hypothetical protein
MRLQELFNTIEIKEAGASTGIVINTNLNPVLWENEKLNNQVAEKLKQIADAFVEFVKIPLDVVDYTLTGSNANYTWNKHSDLDLHVIVRGSVGDAAREFYSAKKAIWGDLHDITIKKLPVECYIQGEEEPHHSTGVYSLTKKDWLIKPQKIRPTFDDNAVTAKEHALVAQVSRALDIDELDHLIRVKEKLVKMRKAGLENTGEWSTENIVFKNLRNSGLIDDLTDRIHQLEDEALSLEQVKPI